MDEIEDNGAIIIGNTEKAAVKTRGFIFKEIFNASDTGDSGKILGDVFNQVQASD